MAVVTSSGFFQVDDIHTFPSVLRASKFVWEGKHDGTNNAARVCALFVCVSSEACPCRASIEEATGSRAFGSA